MEMKKKHNYFYLKWLIKIILSIFLIFIIILILMKWINPPTTTVILAEQLSLNRKVNQAWRTIDTIGKNVILSVLAAEDSNFCNHY